MQTNNLANVLEAMLFVAGEATEISALATAMEVEEEAVVAALDLLEQRYNSGAHGLVLRRYGQHVQLATRADYAPYVERLLQPIQRQSLSQAALETLSVVAYRQPVTRLDVEAVRGVKSDYSLQSLINKGLVREMGRKDTIGRPILYGTTDRFLQHFGLTSLKELPEPEALIELATGAVQTQMDVF